jgi:CubicO group peptidase (beta-lactamase class C family)
VARERNTLEDCFRGSAANPRYGLGWWLGGSGRFGDVFYASGAGGQALYVIPTIDAVIVRFGKSASYKHEPFLKRLLS